MDNQYSSLLNIERSKLSDQVRDIMTVAKKATADIAGPADRATKLVAAIADLVKGPELAETVTFMEMVAMRAGEYPFDLVAAAPTVGGRALHDAIWFNAFRQRSAIVYDGLTNKVRPESIAADLVRHEAFLTALTALLDATYTPPATGPVTTTKASDPKPAPAPSGNGTAEPGTYNGVPHPDGYDTWTRNEKYGWQVAVRKGNPDWRPKAYRAEA